MALRPLDNALPLTPERPKKQLKIAATAPIQKKPVSTMSVNDENLAPLPTGTAQDITIDYIASENLEAFPDPDVKINGLIEGLESKDWIKICESLNDARRFALYHSSMLLPMLGKVMPVIVNAMKNPRSALCKTAIMASSDIFSAFGDYLLDPAISDGFEPLLLQLLLKASQDKKFVCEEADKALKSMVESMTPLPLLHKLRAFGSHTNLRIRAKAAVSISLCISKMELEGMKEYGLVPLIEMAANLLNDRLPEARESARSIVLSAYEKLTENEETKQESWQRFCESNLSPVNALCMLKIVPSQQQ